MKFTNLLGLECETDSNQIIEYPFDVVTLFTDPISLDFIENPIVLIDHMFNIYDYKIIFEWLSRSNKEPTTGIQLDKVKFVPIKNIIYAMMLLEIKENKLIFHQPNIDLLNYINIISCAFENNYAKNQNNELKLPKDSVMYLDLHMYTPNSDNEKSLTEYYCFTLEDLLVNDLFTGKRITNPILTDNGNIIDEKTLKLIPAVYHCYRVDELICKNRHKISECKLLFDKISAMFKNDNYKSKNCGSIIHKKLCQISHFFKNKKTLNFRCNDFYLEATKTYEYIYECYFKLLENIRNGQYKNFEKNKRIISDYVKFNVEAGKESYDANKIYKIEKIRYELQFPVVSNYSVYGDDLSLLDLSYSKFNKKCDGKAREYIGTDLKFTVFSNCEFSICSFICTDLNGTIFENCIFKESVFYKLELKDTQFINCNFDKTTFLGTMNSTKFFNCFFDNFTEKQLKIYQNNGSYSNYILN